MVQRLQHRGPDALGKWVEEHNMLALGHRRLAIQDVSDAGAQPMASRSGRYRIVYNGEVYNFRELQTDLMQSGYQFRGHSDTEVILAAIEQWGLREAVTRFVGMFAFALWDGAERQLNLVRDRIGEKPLYYGMGDRAFLFGSELKALKACPGWRPEIDRQALTLLMRYNYVPTPYSIYEGIKKLPPGSIVTIKQDGDAIAVGEPERYWSIADRWDQCRAEAVVKEPGAAEDELDRLLHQSVQNQMIADVPLGAFLSGGVDSSLVVAIMQHIAEQPVKTFTIGFHEPGYDEAPYAKAVARHLGTDHTELYLNADEARDVIPQLPEIYDEPFSDSSQIPTYLVSRLAREHVTVSLSGDGGDELFGGYNRYVWGRRIWRNIGWMPASARRYLAHGLKSLSPGAWDRGVAPFNALLPQSKRQQRFGDKLHKLADVLAVGAPSEMYRMLISHWKHPEQLVVNGIEPPTSLSGDTGEYGLGDLTERMMLWDMQAYLPDDILVKLDRAAMSVSLETRVPMLDHRLIEFAMGLPLDMKIHGGQGKRLLRQVLYRYVPPELIERPKMGFGIPIDSWLRGPLKEWAGDLLQPDRLKREGYLQPELVQHYLEEHIQGKRNWSYYLWDVLMFQAWLEQNG
jgi:asparagine synthase (glutamine-hydrolysing)